MTFWSLMFIPKEQLGLSSSVTDFRISGETAMAQAGTSEKNCVVLYWLVLYTSDPITSSFSCVVLAASYTRGPITSFFFFLNIPCQVSFLAKLHAWAAKSCPANRINAKTNGREKMSLQLQNKAKALKGKQHPNHAQQQAAETLGQIISPLRQIQTCMLQRLKLLILYYAPCTPKNHSHQHQFPCFSWARQVMLQLPNCT